MAEVIGQILIGLLVIGTVFAFIGLFVWLMEGNAPKLLSYIAWVVVIAVATTLLAVSAWMVGSSVMLLISGG